MNLQRMTQEDVLVLGDRLRKRAQGMSRTNYFMGRLNSPWLTVLETSDSLIFLDLDGDFHRLYFITLDPADLGTALGSLHLEERIVIDLIQRETGDGGAGVGEALAVGGFKPIARFLRMTNPGLRAFSPIHPVSFGTLADLEPILEIIHSKFNKYIDHFPSVGVLRGHLEEGRLLVNRQDGVIRGFIFFEKLGKRFHLNYLFNDGEDPMRFLDLLFGFYASVRREGLSSGFLWVDETNVRVIRLHRSCGFKADGMEDRIYIK